MSNVTINPHPKLLRWLTNPPRRFNDDEQAIVDLLPRYSPQYSGPDVLAPREVPELRAARFQMPPGKKVSAQDGTPITVDTGKREFIDRHGNRMPFDGMARNRPWQRMVKWLSDNFRSE